MQKWTRSQAAAELGVTEKTLYAWEKRGLIPAPERDARGWRWYTREQIEAMRALQRTLHPRRERRQTASPSSEISARNRLRGTVRSVSGDGVLCEVVLELEGGQEIVAVITRSSAERLEIQPGAEAYALIKATEVLLAREA